MRLQSLIVAAILALGMHTPPPQAHSQPGALMVTVLDSLSSRALPNADVIDIASGQRRITDDRGRAYLSWPTDGMIHLRVRQIGYQPRQLTIDRAASGNMTSIALSKIAYMLADVRAIARCSTQVDTANRAMSAVALGQLKQAAEKYNEFRRAYPFEASLERRSALVPAAGNVKRIIVSQERFSSEKFESRYRPGDVIEHRFDEFTVPLLFISTLGDSVFWGHHCFVARGFDWYQGDRVVRLEFSPTADVHGPDYQGAALLDSATSMLLRIDFQLANAPRRDGPTKLEGYTTFMSPSPFVVLPDTTAAVWWVKNADNNEWGKPDYMQALYVKSLKYRKAKPPSRTGESEK